jgi:hypothetical protein
MTTALGLIEPRGTSHNAPDMSPPRPGRLTPLRTKAEVQASNDMVEVYIVEIPNRSASALLECVLSPQLWKKDDL